MKLHKPEGLAFFSMGKAYTANNAQENFYASLNNFLLQPNNEFWLTIDHLSDEEITLGGSNNRQIRGIMRR